MRILIVEDDQRLAAHTAEYLREHDLTVDVVHDGAQGLAQLGTADYDVVLLDLMLPRVDGLEVCRQLRTSSDVSIIMLTARADDVDRVVGLEVGADDYLAKPFNPRELLARIRAVTRRQMRPTPMAFPVTGERWEVDQLVLDRARRVAEFAGQRLDLTAYQFDLLWVLARATPAVVSRTALHHHVRELRGEPPVDFDPAVDRSIDVHMSKIRQALSSSVAGTGLIRTVRRIGYALGHDKPNEH